MRTPLGIVLALLLVGATGAFAGAAEETAAAERGEINLALPGDPGNFDPVINWLHVLAAQQFLTLVDWDYDRSEPIPNAAESWTGSADGRTYTFTLRSGLTLDSGLALRAWRTGWTGRSLSSGLRPGERRLVGTAIVGGIYDTKKTKTTECAGVDQVVLSGGVDRS